MTELKCRHCGHRWIPRKKSTPDRCPSCQKLYPIEDIQAFDLAYPNPLKVFDGTTPEEVRQLASVLEILRGGGPLATVVKAAVDGWRERSAG